MTFKFSLSKFDGTFTGTTSELLELRSWGSYATKQDLEKWKTEIMQAIDQHTASLHEKLALMRTGIGEVNSNVAMVLESSTKQQLAIVGVTGDVSDLKRQLSEILPGQLSAEDQAKLDNSIASFADIFDGMASLAAASKAASDAGIATATALENLDAQTQTAGQNPTGGEQPGPMMAARRMR